MIIDVLSSVAPIPDAFARAGTAFARLDGYLEHFGGADPAVDQAVLEERAADAERAQCPTEAEFITMLDSANVDLAVVFTENYDTTVRISPASNDDLAACVGRLGGRALGLGGVDPWGSDAGQVVERGVRELGLRGYLVSPFKQKLRADDPKMGPIYEKCQELGIPIFLHTGIHWSRSLDYDLDHPRYLDAVAGAYPDLKIVSVHAGWPWLADMMIVAWRHPNIYIDISAHRPRHLAMPTGGGDALLHYGNRMLSDRIMFGSTWTLMQCPIGELIDELRTLPLKPAVLDAWLGGNAQRLFNL